MSLEKRLVIILIFDAHATLIGAYCFVTDNCKDTVSRYCLYIQNFNSGHSYVPCGTAATRPPPRPGVAAARRLHRGRMMTGTCRGERVPPDPPATLAHCRLRDRSAACPCVATDPLSDYLRSQATATNTTHTFKQ